MFEVKALTFPELPGDGKEATKVITEKLLQTVWPMMLSAKEKFLVLDESSTGCRKDLVKLREVFTLCCSQIKKCILHLLEVFKVEHQHGVVLQETRECILERYTWCLDKFTQVIQNLFNLSTNDKISLNESIVATPMYFVDWIDHTFQLLLNLSEMVYRTDYKSSDEVFDTWKNEVIDCVSGLHLSVDELLLSAMTLCRYCLSGDQPIVTARCQVVLRETKALIADLVDGDLNATYKVTKDSLKLPVNPSNINLLIDILKDALYALETNTNTALLTLLVQTFSTHLIPVEVLKDHFSIDSCKCKCGFKDIGQVSEDCNCVKDFDLYNERLMQIGSFSISCSSDESRIMSLRSGLASLEVLEPHLVPALITSSYSHHTRLLADSWKQEVYEIRENVFLIVEPYAFTEKSKHIMNKKLKELIRNNTYDSTLVCSVIDIGGLVQEFFTAYNKYEPESLLQYEKLQDLLKNLSKVLNECRTVDNLLSKSTDFFHNEQKHMKTDTNVTLEKLIKRLKLLYTIINRMSDSLDTKDNDENMFGNEAFESKSVKIQTSTYVRNSHKKNIGLSKTMFARTGIYRSVNKSQCILSKLTKHINLKKTQELSFSVRLDDLFNEVSQYHDETHQQNIENTIILNKNLSSIRSNSIMYNFSPGKNRASLRKAVLYKQYVNSQDTQGLTFTTNDETQSVMDSSVNLQITDILDQLNDLTNTLSTTQQYTTRASVIPINTFRVIQTNSHINNTFSSNDFSNKPSGKLVDASNFSSFKPVPASSSFIHQPTNKVSSKDGNSNLDTDLSSVSASNTTCPNETSAGDSFKTAIASNISSLDDGSIASNNSTLNLTLAYNRSPNPTLASNDISNNLAFASNSGSISIDDSNTNPNVTSADNCSPSRPMIATNNSHLNLSVASNTSPILAFASNDHPNSTLAKNVLRLKINDGVIQPAKCVWNIPVTDSTVEISLSSADSSTSGQPSDVTTFERLNDIHLLENKLSNLRSNFNRNK